MNVFIALKGTHFLFYFYLTEIFNSYFVNVASNLKEPSIPTDFEIINNYVQSKVPTKTEFQISL